MAGIGFELKRVIEKGGVFSFLKAAFSGVMIVAGPWLISIVSIYTISRLIAFLPGLEQQLFIASVIYSYAFSLVLFGGTHFIFTRIIADGMYEKKFREASALLLFFLLLIGIVSAGIGGTAASFSGIDTEYTGLLTAGGVLLFGSINCIWIVMLFVSLVKWYGKILLSYLGGMASSAGFMILLSRPFGIAGALTGFGLGQCLIFIALLLLSLREYPPAKFGTGVEKIGPYFKKHRALFITGQLYSAGIWADKIIFWFASGSRIGNTIFYLFPSYDVAVYVGTLTMIPGLVYFIVGTEPAIFVDIKKFLLSLDLGKLREIQLLKYGMLRSMRVHLKRLTFFGAVIALAAILLVPLLTELLKSSSWNHLLLTFSAVFTHFCFLSYMNILFYLNFYRYTGIASLIFAGVNLGVSAVTAFTGFPFLAGLGYLLGGGAAALFAYVMLFREGRKIDRYILSGSSA